jgi:phosphoglucosamine mutase
MYESALCAGLTASGADAYLLHVTSTPSVSYITRSDDFDCGIMISASHNPYHDNGIKLINSDGEKMEEDFLLGIEAYLDSNEELPYAKDDAIGRTVDYAAGRNRYIGYLISLATRSYKGRKIGLDCANGSTWQMAKSVFDALGADTYVIANKPDGLNINVDCGSTHLGNLKKFVVENGLEVGFAFDGDADRCLAVDEFGNEINGDHIMYVCAKYMKEKGKFGDSKVVTTVMSNMGLYKALDELGIGYEKTAVGDKYVAENMRQNGHLLGGEQSGHIIFGRLATTGDGLMTAIKVMEAITETKESLATLASGMTMYPQVLKNVVVTDKDETLNCEEVKAAVKKAEDELGDNGRILLRKSGTEPLLRVMAEATTHELCEEKVDAIIDAMRAAGKLIKVK